MTPLTPEARIADFLLDAPGYAMTIRNIAKLAWETNSTSEGRIASLAWRLSEFTTRVIPCVPLQGSLAEVLMREAVGLVSFHQIAVAVASRLEWPGY